jgi:hypothetical protein
MKTRQELEQHEGELIGRFNATENGAEAETLLAEIAELQAVMLAMDSARAGGI